MAKNCNAVTSKHGDQARLLVTGAKHLPFTF
jgi:hypothetical protein